MNNNKINVIKRNGSKVEFDAKKINESVKRACKGLKNVNYNTIVYNAEVKLYDGVTTKEIDDALIKSVRALVEEEPEYRFVAARILLSTIYKECFGCGTDDSVFAMQYKTFFRTNMNTLIKEGTINPALKKYDFSKILDALKPERDLLFGYEGLAAVAERYLFKRNDKIVETPQAWLMRVSMGLALSEKESERTDRAIEFYNLLSTFSYMCSTPTLFYSGSTKNQLSSCFLNTFEDSIYGIFDGLHQEAQKSKFAGGLGMDFTPIRAGNAFINGTNGYTQGAVFFWKLFNDMLVAVNQCFPGDTKVITQQGIKLLQNIKENSDYVLTKNGWRIVEELYYYPKDGKELIDIKLRHGYEPISTTEGHPFYAIIGHRSSVTGLCNKEVLKLLERGDQKVGWVEAKDLKINQYIGFPIPTDTDPHLRWTVDDAKLYGLMLGDGWITKSKLEMGICFNSETNAETIRFVSDYLDKKEINYWINDGKQIEGMSDKYISLVWSYKKHIDKLPFDYDDIYCKIRKKRVSSRLLTMRNELIHHIIAGLVLSDGHVHFNKEITFYNNSEELIDNVRYLLLKVGVLCGGNINRGKINGNVNLKGIHKVDSDDSFVLRIPAYDELAAILDIQPITKKHWLSYNGMVFTRIKSISRAAREFPIDLYDLKVNGEPNYTLMSGGLVHNGGKRRGAGCGYLETWHYDIEDFLALRKNVGDERRRTHDMNTANWIPDLFMKQVMNDGEWYLFSPDETPDLHSLFGAAFESRYWQYVEDGKAGKIKLFKEIKAKDLWRTMIKMLFETGHPWITFKDPCNIRYTNQHKGTVNSSNLCTEITLHSKATRYEANNNRCVEEYGETAVCNLGSINLKNHLKYTDGKCTIDYGKLSETIKTGMRMLDNVIDINFYPTQEAKISNTSHRPVGMGTMGWHDVFIAMDIDYDSDEAIKLSDHLYEFISRQTIYNSSLLAKEKGRYSTYEGSLWDQNIFPIDSFATLMKDRKIDEKDAWFLSRGEDHDLNWEFVREHVKQYGMRNSNTMAIAPTATISQIVGCSSCTEPYFNVLYVRSVLGGDFTVINEWFVNDMKALDMWNHSMVNKLKVVDGDLSKISEIPANIVSKYKSAFNVDQFQLLRAAAARGKWIDMAMSVNLFNNFSSTKYLHDLYSTAWNLGLKTTYYLRNRGASQVEKASVDSKLSMDVDESPQPSVCLLDDPTCQSCQ